MAIRFGQVVSPFLRVDGLHVMWAASPIYKSNIVYAGKCTPSNLMGKFKGDAQNIFVCLLMIRKKEGKDEIPIASSFYYFINSTKYINSYHVPREKRTYIRDDSFFTVLQFVISFTRFFPNGLLCDFSFRPKNCSNIEYQFVPFYPLLISSWSIWSIAISGSVL